jgi:uncharacterized protein YjbI with pentapeptide repeats
MIKSGTQPLLRRLLSSIQDRLILLFLLVMIVLMSLVLGFLSAVLEVSKPAEWWLGWALVEFSRAAVLVVLLTRFFTVRLRQDTVQYKLFQRFFLRRLKLAETLRARQHVLDRMMLENLLAGADLSGAQLAEVHLEGANLKRIRLWRADLSGADLESANLEDGWLDEVNLSYAKLTSAHLHRAQLARSYLERVNLANANLSEAHLKQADLHNASLYDAELQQACLDRANLCASNLLYANLQGASLWGTLFNETTVLPDGTYWTADTDMSRFTDSQHPDFVTYAGPDAAIFKERLLSS